MTAAAGAAEARAIREYSQDSISLSLSTSYFKLNKARKLCMQDTQRRTCQPAEEFRTGQVKQAVYDSFWTALQHFAAGDSLASVALARTHIAVNTLQS